MDILLVSNEDICRSRIAKELLHSFGRGMNITTCGVNAGNLIPDEVADVLEQNGYEISRKKPLQIEECASRKWGYIITLCSEAAQEVKSMNIHADGVSELEYDDVWSIRESDYTDAVNTLYRDMYRGLYELYRDVLSDLLLPRCTCGANTYCRCE